MREQILQLQGINGILVWQVRDFRGAAAATSNWCRRATAACDDVPSLTPRSYLLPLFFSVLLSLKSCSPSLVGLDRFGFEQQVEELVGRNTGRRCWWMGDWRL